MFGRRILGGHPDAFKMTLGFEVAGPEFPPSPNSTAAAATPKAQQPKVLEEWEEELPGTVLELADVDWTSDDPDPVAISRLKKNGSIEGILEERIVLDLRVVHNDGMVNAATFQKDVQATLKVVEVPPQLRRLEFARTSPSGTPHLTLLTTLMGECHLEGLRRLQCMEGLIPLWEAGLTDRLADLRCLLLPSCGLSTLPAALGKLTGLRELRVPSNRLTALPHEIGLLVKLQKLVADNNLITSIPVELRHCSELREISLENNKLATPVLDLRALSGLHSLQLFGNPLEFLPELNPCRYLRNLSLANVRLQSNEQWTAWEVEVTPPSQSYMGRGAHKLASLFGLIFRRSTCQHPLLAGALGRIAEDPLNCAIIAREVGAIQQLILMALSDNEVVVEQACKVIGLLGQHNSITTNEIIDRNVLATMVSLIQSVKHKNQLAGLRVVSGLALSSEAAAKKLLMKPLLNGLKDLARSGADDVKTAALETIGNLAFARENKVTFLHTPGLLAWLNRLARGQVGGVSQKGVQITATRALAVLGENEAVRIAVGKPAIVDRGVRILSMDGGGMKGMAIIRQLRQLEERTGRRIHELFDLICGTSTGGLLAVALALKHFTLDECELIYRGLGQRVFSRPGTAANKDEDGWRESLYRVYKSGQQSMRVAVYGCKHDAAMFELLLREYCIFDQPGLSGDSMIDTACLSTPKCFVVSTLASMTPAEPFLFRNYEYPLSATPPAKKMMAAPGSSSHQVWQAVRASSAAPYYLDDFKCGNDRFQDGAATANNPSILAIQQARLLWPDTHIEALVSIGSGTVPVHRREKSMSAYVDTGNVLIESACSVDKAAGALAALAPLIPGLTYHRFCPSDMRCGMDLDEIDPARWALLDAATDKYIADEDAAFDACARLLVHNVVDHQRKPADIHSLALGSRRKIAVVQAARGGMHAHLGATSHVEAVARALTSLQQCCTQLDFESAPQSSPETEAGGEGKAIAAMVEAHRNEVGVVHLGLYGSTAGLVVSWRQSLQAIAEPSEAASRLVMEAGPNAATSLSELANVCPGFEGLDSSWVQLLSHQALLTQGHPVAAVMLQRTQADRHLTPEEVQKMSNCWDQQIVVTSSVIPSELVRALLEAGAKAVVCRRAEAHFKEGLQEPVDFMTAFYRYLLAGRPIVKALEHAGSVVPALAQDYFCCALSPDGSVIAAEIAAKTDTPSASPTEANEPTSKEAGGPGSPYGRSLSKKR